ncbi:MAG: hypothetical protein ACRCYX_14055 [Dermatophilaceae bacterium]
MRILSRTVGTLLLAFVTSFVVISWSFFQAMREARAAGGGSGGIFGVTLAEASCTTSGCTTTAGDAWWVAVTGCVVASVATTAAVSWAVGRRDDRGAVVDPGRAAS